MRREVVEDHFDQDQAGELALLVVSGSQAYGLAHEGSDLDLRGVYVAPTNDFLRLGTPREQVVIHDPDATVFELRKFCRLAAAGNPNILEMLFTPSENIVAASAVWAQVLEVRSAFLSRRVYDAFLSYARSQWHDAKRLMEGGEAVHRWKDRTRRKHLGHVFRVLDEGATLLKTGEMQVRVRDVEGLRALTQRPLEELTEMIKERHRALEAIPCPFEEEANWEVIDSLLVSVRVEMLERERRQGPQSWNLATIDYEGAGWPRPTVKDVGSALSLDEGIS